MALTKVSYTDHSTVITADNLNDIQDEIISTTGYATCSTAAATVAKTATLSDFTLATGATVRIKFTYTNTASSPTLNVNSTGAKSIMRYGTTAVGTSIPLSWPAGAVVTFVYDGTYWVMADVSLSGISDIIQVTTPTFTSLSQTYTVSGMTASHVLIQEGSAFVSVPSSMGSDWTLTPGSGTLTISGTFLGSTATYVKATFGILGNSVTATS